MDSEVLSYHKEEGSTPLRGPLQTQSAIPSRSHGVVRRAPYSKSHDKGPSVLTPAIVYVLSGGEDREKTFFRTLRNDPILSSCVQIIFQSKKGQGLQPFQMDSLWQQGRRRGKIMVEGKVYRLSKLDKVFLVTDVDEFESQIVDILKTRPKEDTAHWIISNPCIEIWLYYCFKNNLAPEVLKLRYVSRAHRSQRMKQLNHILVNGGADPRKAFDNTQDGIANSKTHFRKGHYGIPRLFATTFYIMMEQILQFIVDRGRSFADYQEAKRKRIEAFLTGKDESI